MKDGIKSTNTLPSWASRASGNLPGVGGFSDLSGLEEKSIPEPGTVPIVKAEPLGMAASPAMLEDGSVPDIRTPSLSLQKNPEEARNPDYRLKQGPLGYLMAPDKHAGIESESALGGVLRRYRGMVKPGEKTEAGTTRSTVDPNHTLEFRRRQFYLDNPKIKDPKVGGEATPKPQALAPAAEPEAPNVASTLKKATLTFYNGLDDQYGSTTARPGNSGKAEAEHGITVAVDPKVIPYNSRIYIPSLKKFSKNGDGIFIAHDTGSAVKSRKASKGRGNSNPVIDIYANVPSNELGSLNKQLGYTTFYQVLPPDA